MKIMRTETVAVDVSNLAREGGEENRLPQHRTYAGAAHEESDLQGVPAQPAVIARLFAEQRDVLLRQ
jgi:hypothetical protein